MPKRTKKTRRIKKKIKKSSKKVSRKREARKISTQSTEEPIILQPPRGMRDILPH